MIYVIFECEGRIKTKLEPATRRNSLLFAKRGGGGGGGKWPGDVGLILFSTPKVCPAGWGHNLLVEL